MNSLSGGQLINYLPISYWETHLFRKGNQMENKNQGVVLVGHGGLPSDFPSEQVSKLMRLEKERRRTKQQPTAEEIEIDRTLRHWPRTATSDPYQAGLEQLGTHLAPLLDGKKVKLAYNEFCAPNLTEAIEDMIEQGVEHITVISTMFTPGGSHSEQEIPEELEPLQEKYADITIVYAWPYDLTKVAHLLREQINAFDVHACEN